MMGTPCDVPEPRKMKAQDIILCSVFFANCAKNLLPNPSIKATFSANQLAMLTTLRIKNLALVADLTLELEPGYNVITGETGAGKSILIGALNLVLGERADRTLIRSGADASSVEAVFDTAKLAEKPDAFLEENGLEPCADHQLIIK